MAPTELVKVNTLDISSLTNNKIHQDTEYREITDRINLIGESMFVVESFYKKNNYSVKTVYKINGNGDTYYKLFTLLMPFPDYNSAILPVLDLNCSKTGATTYIFYIIKNHDPNVFISEKKIDVDIRYLSIDICEQNKNINQHAATYEFDKIQQLLNSKFTKQYINYDIFNIINTDLIFVETDEHNSNNLVIISYTGDIKYKYDIGLYWIFSHYLYKYICQSNIKYDINDIYELSCWTYNFNADPHIHKLYIHFNLIKNYLYNSNLLSSYLPNELIALCDTYFYKSYKCIDILPSVKGGCNIM